MPEEFTLAQFCRALAIHAALCRDHNAINYQVDFHGIEKMATAIEAFSRGGMLVDAKAAANPAPEPDAATGEASASPFTTD